MDQPVEHDTSEAPKLRRRSLSRLVAAQALYQIEINQESMDVVLQQFRQHHFKKHNKPFSLADKALFEELVKGVCETHPHFDPLIEKCLSEWHFNRLDYLIRAILRLGAYELSYNLHLSSAIILNEYIDITKAFFDHKESAFVNGVLDALVPTLRPESHDEPTSP